MLFDGPVQVEKGREELMSPENGWLLPKLLVYTQYRESIVRRGGIIGALRNCCFNFSVSVLVKDEFETVLVP